MVSCADSESAQFRANDHDELIISEYVEGSSFNKAVELFNPTLAAIDLSDYQLDVFFNGDTRSATSVRLSGEIPSGGTHVIVHAQADRELLELADTVTSSALFNGDDAVVLSHGSLVVDSIGQIGVDPGSEWDGEGGTRDNVLRRNADIGDGDALAFDAFDAGVEWAGAVLDDYSGLGQHDFVIEGSDDPGNPSGDGFTKIHTIQGSGSVTPLAGEDVEVRAVVVAVANDLSGFFLQEESSDIDRDPQTSEGIFVFARNAGVEVGDVVEVAGTVTEFDEITELSAFSGGIQVVDQAPLPPPSVLQLPFESLDGLESVESMRVTFSQSLFVTDTHLLGFQGQIAVSSGERLPNPTQVAAPGSEANAVAAANALNRLLVDDLSNGTDPDPIVFPAPELTATRTLRGGTEVRGLTGVIHVVDGQMALRATEAPAFDLSSNPREPAPSRRGEVRVASFNVLNYFNGNGAGGGFPTARGADTALEFERQTAKIVAAVTELDADIIGLMEVENDGFGSTSAIAELVDHLNDAASFGTSYRFVDPGVSRIGNDAISVGFIYRAETIQPVGDAAILDGDVDPRFNDSKNRPTLAQSFESLASGGVLTVAVNHFKSKGSTCDELGDPDRGDGQGNCNLTRTRAAEAVVDWLADSPTGVVDDDRVIMGDLNAYDREDPVEAIRAGDYQSVVGPDDYSFSFDGEWGALDHQLVTPSLHGQLVFAGHWHINADEPQRLDYNTENKSSHQVDVLFASDSFRASDHDPIVADFDLR